ncbi:MAG TPA: CHAD domain-containing protein [Steroidobacteraceae bacterium]|nr:CHAD domain-containing protein [Steroidobacteraceae bacterium]
MASEVAQSDAGAKSIRRIMRTQLKKALESLAVRRLTDERIHDARKRIKKARAALRLLRDAVGKGTYTRANTAMRDVTRPLSQVRDSKVMLDTLEKLMDRFDQKCRGLSLDGFRRVLNRERQALRRQLLGRAAPLKSQITTLRRIHSRAKNWHVGTQDWSVIGCGLERVYGKGRRALSAAETEGTPECFHEWRKQVKYLRHQIEFLTPVWPEVLRELADQAHKLADDLGDEHDLTVLRQKAQAHQDTLANDSSVLLALIDRRRIELRDKAVIRGRQLYEEKPGTFAMRLRGYWTNWHQGTAHPTASADASASIAA